MIACGPRRRMIYLWHLAANLRTLSLLFTCFGVCATVQYGEALEGRLAFFLSLGLPWTWKYEAQRNVKGSLRESNSRLVPMMAILEHLWFGGASRTLCDTYELPLGGSSTECVGKAVKRLKLILSPEPRLSTKLGVLVSCGCHNKTPCLGLARQWKLFSSSSGGQKSETKVSAGLVSSRGSWGESAPPTIPHQLTAAVGNPWCSLVCRRITPISVSRVTPHPWAFLIFKDTLMGFCVRPAAGWPHR